MRRRTDSFSPHFFEQLKKAEEKHFWFQVRRRWILEKMKKFAPPPARFLEVGCGTGNVSSFLAQRGYQVVGCEFYQEAIELAWPGFEIVQGDARRLPFENDSFDIAGLLDVIEHCDDDRAVLEEAVRVVRSSGIIVITVPARKELWSRFDEVAFHKRRYTQKMVAELLSSVGLDLLAISYMFMSLYVPARCLRKKRGERDDPLRINRFGNTLLKAVCDLERFVSRTLPLPIGTSLIAIARK